MGNPWFRRWVGAISDPKIAEAAMMAETSRSVVNSVWDAILESASELDERGGFATTPRRVAATLCEPLGVIEAVFAAMGELGMIRDGVVVSWEKRQPPSESRADAAERQRQSRAARGVGAPRHNLSQDVTAPESETDIPPPPPAGARAKPGFGELTGAPVLPLGADPLEAEARLLAAGLPLAEDRDFAAVAALIAGGGASREDLLAAIEDGRNCGAGCPKTWATLARWATRKARKRGGDPAAGARAPPAGRSSDLAVCLQLAAGETLAAIDARPSPDLAAEAALARCRRGLSRAGPRIEIAAASAPSEAERAALTARRAALDRALTPAGRDDARRKVAALFAKIPSGRARAEETREQIELFAGSLERLPSWAIAAAARGCIAAGAKFRPGSGELVKAARDAGGPLWAEAERIGEVLGAAVQAPRPSAEERARAVAAYRARTAGLEGLEGAA